MGMNLFGKTITIAVIAFAGLCAAAHADDQAAPRLTKGQAMVLQKKINRARYNLARIDRMIRDREQDLGVYGSLMPRYKDGAAEESIYESDIEGARAHLAKLRATRARLAHAIVWASNRFDLGKADLKPVRTYASQGSRRQRPRPAEPQSDDGYVPQWKSYP